MRVNPLVLLLFNGFVPISLMFPGNPYQSVFFLSFASLLLLLLGRIRRLVKFLCCYGIFFLLQTVWLDYFTKVPAAIMMIFIISIQFIPCIMVASVLIYDYSAGELVSALDQIHIPKIFSVALVVVLRYIPTFQKEFGYIKESMRLRGIPYSWKRPLQSFSYFLVPQLFRCEILSMELSAAGLTKGITHPVKRSSYQVVAFRWWDAVLCCAFCLALGVSIIWR